MYKATAALRSTTPYQQRRHINPARFPKLSRESDDAYEQRVWREAAHYTPDGHVLVPPTQFKKVFDNAARYAKEKIKGKQNTTYINACISAVQCLQGIPTDLTRETLEGTSVFVPANGKPGGGSRVNRIFPTIPAWEGATEWFIYDDIITPEIFQRYLRAAGLLIGLGVWRINKGGMYGRFEVLSCTIEDMTY